jgi:alkylhydroperoxidase family enzyme
LSISSSDSLPFHITLLVSLHLVAEHCIIYNTMARLPYLNYTYQSRPTINAVKLLAHSPATAEHWTAVGTAHFRSLAVSKKLRELATLYLSARFGSSYEWDHHIPLSAKAGVTEAQRGILHEDAVKDEDFFANGRGEGVFEGQENAMLAFLEAVVKGPEVSDELWEKTRKNFSDREIVELLSLLVGQRSKNILYLLMCV